MAQRIEKIETLHPMGKSGVNISKDKYDTIASFILEEIGSNKELTFKQLTENANKKLKSFDGKITWYITTVKLDLEARGSIERISGKSPQTLKIK